jgi:hypothetical protein
LWSDTLVRLQQLFTWRDIVFIGHFGVALAAKRIAPKTSLGTLVFAAEFLDLTWPILLLLGVEHVRIAPRVSPFDFTTIQSHTAC